MRDEGSNKKPNNFIISFPNKFLFSFDYFKLRLYLEKRRAERQNLQFSLIIIHLDKIALEKKTFDWTLGKKYKKLLRNIANVIRETDAVTLYKNTVVLILLPDTDNKGALKVCEKIINYLKKSCSDNFNKKDSDFDNLIIEIVTYPQNDLEKKFLSIITKYGSIKPVFEKNHEDSFSKDQLSIDNLYKLQNGRTLINDILFSDQKFVGGFFIFINTKLKRMIDILGSLSAFVLFFPIIIIIALLIKATSAGSILYQQKRIGYKGKIFNCLKFRTMYPNSDEQIHHDYVRKLIQNNGPEINNGTIDKPLYKISNDPRITPVGRFIRALSLDELPQLWNVFKGEMSLVGPRPPIPYEVKEYKSWHNRRFFDVKPGMTGLWQISGRNQTTFDEMVRFDIYYAIHRSIILDFFIMFKTFKLLFVPNGR